MTSCRVRGAKSERALSHNCEKCWTGRAEPKANKLRRNVMRTRRRVGRTNGAFRRTKRLEASVRSRLACADDFEIGVIALGNRLHAIGICQHSDVNDLRILAGAERTAVK